MLVAIWVVVHRQDLIDWWRLRNYTPPAQIVQLADATTMHGKARDLFYASQPEVNSKEQFNENCTDLSEESLVLGCYKAQRIYIYDVADQRLSGVKEVTAAHEMLHAVYERLGDDERQQINDMLASTQQKVQDTRLQDLVALYNKHEPGELYNELHSILATEYRNLPTDLETYYKRYFTDRMKVVNLAEGYSAQFVASEKRLEALEAQLASLKQRIDANTTLLQQRKEELDQDAKRLDTLRTRDAATYNQAVPGYNAKVAAYNNLVQETQAHIAKYNGLVTERNNEAAAHNDLYHSLDSQYQPVAN